MRPNSTAVSGPNTNTGPAVTRLGLTASGEYQQHETTCTHSISRGSRPMSHLSLTRSKLSWLSTWLHHANREHQIHSPGGVTTRPGFLFSVTPLDVTWRSLRRACLVNVSSAPLMTSEHVYWLKISNAWFLLKQTWCETVNSFLTLAWRPTSLVHFKF